ncbi:MAG: hypothetical protein AAF663_00120 [Planctomycetota bacterium]
MDARVVELWIKSSLALAVGVLLGVFVVSGARGQGWSETPDPLTDAHVWTYTPTNPNTAAVTFFVWSNELQINTGAITDQEAPFQYPAAVLFDLGVGSYYPQALERPADDPGGVLAGPVNLDVPQGGLVILDEDGAPPLAGDPVIGDVQIRVEDGLRNPSDGGFVESFNVWWASDVQPMLVTLTRDPDFISSKKDVWAAHALGHYHRLKLHESIESLQAGVPAEILAQLNLIEAQTTAAQTAISNLDPFDASGLEERLDVLEAQVGQLTVAMGSLADQPITLTDEQLAQVAQAVVDALPAAGQPVGGGPTVIRLELVGVAAEPQDPGP